jgi:chromosomal replication initiation ATPase DnaA
MNRFEVPPGVRKILEHVARKHATSAADILGGSQQANICAARWEVIQQLADDPRGFSSVQIGRWMRRHHSSILHCLKVRRTAYPNTRLKVHPDDAPYDPTKPDTSGEWAI